MDEVGPGARTVDAPLSAIAAYVATVIPAGEDGGDGEDGTDGREVELQKSATHVQWRYVGDTTWTDIVPLSEITGVKGEQGDKGDVGPTPTLQPNHVFAGPVSGSPAPAAGRPLIGADLPVIADGIVFTISNRGEIATPSTNYDESLPLSLPSTVAKITFTTHIDNTGSATTTLNAYKRTPAGAKTSLLSANATLAPGASVAVASLSTTPGVLSLAVGDRVGVDLIGLGTDASGIKCIVELTRPAV